MAPLLAGILVSVAITTLVAGAFFQSRAQQLRDHRERSEQKARFEAAKKAHQILVSFVVHEQRNPLHLCSGSLGMLKEASAGAGEAAEQALAVLDGALRQNRTVAAQW